MWTCKQCGENFAIEAAPPEIDEKGLYFICPKCDQRNCLWKIGGPGMRDPLALVQLEA